MTNESTSGELTSVDVSDAISREALAQARRIEEAERYRNNPGPVGPPRPSHVSTLTPEDPI